MLVGTDVTAQQQASQYARSLIEASLDPLVTISPEGKITDVNEGSIKVTGVARDRLIGFVPIARSVTLSSKRPLRFDIRFDSAARIPALTPENTLPHLATAHVHTPRRQARSSGAVAGLLPELGAPRAR